MFYGHSGKNHDKSDWQSLRDHLQGVSYLAADYASPFGGSELAALAGLLHDIGKYSEAFQRRLEGSPHKVDHTSAGAREAVSLFGPFWGRLLAYLIVGHHGGIPDWDDASPYSVHARLVKDGLEDYSAWESELAGLIKEMKPAAKIKSAGENRGFQTVHFMRMLYSCLVDADYLDTEKAFGSIDAGLRRSSAPLQELISPLSARLETLGKQVELTPVNLHRGSILKQCTDKAVLNRGMFTLTVPTGGGKTLSSMAFAMNHAIHNGMDRVIYVIPYTSIIEQNACVFRGIFGEDNVLEHHSNYASDDWADDVETTDFQNRSTRLATQNWQAPIVVTTNVQFFESFFSNKPSKCRKLHHVANSVIILDEAQMLPVELLKPSVSLLGELVLNNRCTVVLCTATQPALNAYIPKPVQPLEIMESPQSLSEAFRRVRIEVMGPDALTDAALAQQLRAYDQVLCIVNTRKHAYRLFVELEDGAGHYHLSARMCSEHRREVLDEIRERLKSGLKCRVISTQLIEAGVDVDFPVVYRAMSGLDSIAQSAGRCNREGKLDYGRVMVFEPERHGMPKGYLSLTASKAREILGKYKDDPLGLNAVAAYFDSLYTTEKELLDRNEILKLHNTGAETMEIPFDEIAKKYRIIESGMKSVVIPFMAHKEPGRTHEWIESARKSAHPWSYTKQFQRFTVQVYAHEFSKLENAGAIERVGDIFDVLQDRTLYSEKYGLQLPGDWDPLSEALIF